MQETIYKTFKIIHFKPRAMGRTYYRIYHSSGEFMQTARSVKQAKGIIDFNLECEVWGA